jgi:phosphopentomutase
VPGYAYALEQLDQRIPELEKLMGADDLVLVTADHGCDPTMPGSDHTREHVPAVFVGAQVKPQSLGLRDTFADMGQTLADYFDLPPLKVGRVCKLN